MARPIFVSAFHKKCKRRAFPHPTNRRAAERARCAGGTHACAPRGCRRPLPPRALHAARPGAARRLSSQNRLKTEPALTLSPFTSTLHPNLAQGPYTQHKATRAGASYILCARNAHTHRQRNAQRGRDQAPRRQAARPRHALENSRDINAPPGLAITSTPSHYRRCGFGIVWLCCGAPATLCFAPGQTARCVPPAHPRRRTAQRGGRPRPGRAPKAKNKKGKKPNVVRWAGGPLQDVRRPAVSPTM